MHRPQWFTSISGPPPRTPYAGRTFIFYGFLSLLAICLTGCAVDQAGEVEKYRQITDQATTRPSSYKTNEPLSLANALALANQNNEEIASRGEDLLQAYYAKDRAFAAFLPTVDFAVSYFRRQDGGSNFNNEVTDVSVPASINLFRGFSDKNRLGAAALTIQEREFLLKNFQQDLLLQVAITYYQVLRAEQSAVVLSKSLVLQTARVRDVRAREQAGLARLLDVAQTQAQVSATQVALIEAQNVSKNGRALLGYLIGMDVGNSPLVDNLTPPDTLPSVTDFQYAASFTRLDIQAAQTLIDARRSIVDATVGRYYPSVSLNLEAFLFKQSEPTVSKWAALLEMNMPIFTAGVIEADVKTAWSEFRKAILNESNLRRRVMSDILATFDDVNDAALAIEQLRLQENAAQLALNQSTAAYKVGLATNLEQLIAQDQLLNAQLGITTTAYDRKLSYLSLCRLAGQSIPQLVDRSGSLKLEIPDQPQYPLQAAQNQTQPQD